MLNNYGVEMISVSSSNVSEIGYDEAAQELYVRFINTAVFQSLNLRGCKTLRQSVLI
jgi:hypothetical protein